MSKQETLAKRIYEILVDRGEPMTLQGISEEIQDKPTATIRGRIYDNLGRLFRKIARGVYWVEGEDVACVVLEADGRKGLSLVSDSSVDALINDHPWSMEKSHKGGNRNFTSDYDCFRYTLEDFEEKARVLKEGHFLVEIVPEENAENFEYLYQIKKMAEKAGLYYYAKVPWKKGKISNCGRKSKDVEDVLFFTKGKRARNLRPDKKKILQGQKDAKMSGTAYMLPTQFDVQAPSNKERIHQAEKPLSLYEEILEAITLPGELVIDQYCGAAGVGVAALKKKRFSLLFEILRSNIDLIVKRLGATAIYKEHLVQDRKQSEDSIPIEMVQLSLF
jgi:DNA modification methylase